MARGTESKGIVFNKLQEVFSGAFWEDKDKILRIPLIENGDRIEIKVTLTAAKTNLGGDAPVSAFELAGSPVPTKVPEEKQETTESRSIEPTQEEKDNVKRLIEALGL